MISRNIFLTVHTVGLMNHMIGFYFAILVATYIVVIDLSPIHDTVYIHKN